MTLADAQFVLQGLHNVYWGLFCLFGIGVVVTLVLLLRRQERKLTSAGVARWLMALRITVLLLLLLVLMQPVYSWSLDRDRTGRIVVALDLSQSMQGVDEHATPIEKLRWARAVGAIGNPAVDAQLDEWEARLADNPDAADAIPEDLDLPDDVLDSVLESVDQLSRREIARRLLLETNRPLIEHLESLAAVDIVVFAGRAQSQDVAGLNSAVEEVPDSLLPDVSDIARSLDASLTQNDDAALLGVVLLSDGRDTGDGDPLAAANRLSQVGAPVFPVLIGSSFRPKDLAVLSVNYPPTVFTDDHPIISAVLTTVGYTGEQITVNLEDDDGNIQTQTIDVDRESVGVQFNVDVGEPGRRGYRLSIDEDENEARDDNNERSFAMSIVDDTVQTVLMDGVARWEFRFIDNALTRDSRINVSKVVFDQPYIGLLPDTFFPRQLPFDPQDKEDALDLISDADLIVIGDVAPEDLSEQHWAILEHFVAEVGGTLVLQSGKNDFPVRHRSKSLQRLMPVTDLRTIEVKSPAAATAPTARGVRLSLTDDGEQFPFLKLATERHRNQLVWSSFPGHLWMHVGAAKPGATVLAIPKLIRGELKLDEQRRYGSIVHQHYGFGQVVWMGLDSTWRWRHRVGDLYHHKYWGQMARWAADNKVAAGNEFVRFGPQVTDSVSGDDVILLARWVPSFLRKNPNLEAEAEVFRIGKDGRESLFATVPLKSNGRRNNIMEGRVIGLPVGRFKTRLKTDALPKDLDVVECEFYVHAKQTAELADLSADSKLLQEVAERTGGQLLYPHQVADFPELLQQRLQLTEVDREVELWDHWMLMVVFFALLATEWIVRKLNGLP